LTKQDKNLLRDHDKNADNLCVNNALKIRSLAACCQSVVVDEFLHCHSTQPGHPSMGRHNEY